MRTVSGMIVGLLYSIVFHFSTHWLGHNYITETSTEMLNKHERLFATSIVSPHVHLSTSFTFSAVLLLHHTILPSEYESVLAANDIVNMAVVIKDVRTKERALAMQEFNLRSLDITIEVQQYPAYLFFISQKKM